MEVIFKVIRTQTISVPRIQTYTLDVQPAWTVLECLNQIKWNLDGSLAYRKNCRNTICGSCGMKINGRSALACKQSIALELREVSQSNSKIPEITIAPLGNMPVIKDLVVDMKGFWDNLEIVEPYVSTAARKIPEREFLQTPQERSQLERSGNCIMCGACYSECNAREVNSDFVGPHALAKAQRMIADPRDVTTEKRLELSNKGTDGVWGCTRCYMCNAVCPMEVAPMERISEIKREILQGEDEGASRSIRHRKVLVELVKQGGWIDERQFSVMVVGNYLRDWVGLLSIFPLGLRMLAHGKFPFSFEPSEGTEEVRSLIESIQEISQ